MSYLVLARKYRPRNFSEMVGQDHVVQALGNALATQRLHHAYLFTGTRGVGKTTVSRILAKSLNCQGPDGLGGITATPCGVCLACRDIDSGRFVDYTELDAASNRGVDEVQTLLEQAVYKPVQGRFKVFMVDEVHMLTNTAFNAMLKTLEEPPEYLKFVLATTDPQKVPMTVLSRCLQFNLRPMAPQTIREHLVQVLEKEQVPAEAAALRLLARAAHGSMRDALSLTDQAIAFGAGQLQEATVRQMLGSVDRSYVYRLIEALAQGDGKTVVQTCEQLRRHGLSAASTLEEMASVLQTMAVLQVTDSPLDDDGEGLECARLAQLLAADETQLLYSICLHGRADLGLAPDEYAALTMVLLRLLAFKAPAQGAVAEKKSLNKPPVVAAAAGPAVAAARVPEEKVAAPQAATPSTASPLPWEATPVPAVPAATVAPAVPAEAPVPQESAVAEGRRLPVRSPGTVAQISENLERNEALSGMESSVDATKIVAIPVRSAPASRADAAPATATLLPTPEGDFWHSTVQQLVASEAVAALVRELALQSQLVARDGDHWLLRVEREALNQAGARERLGNALAEMGHAVRLAVEVGRVSDSPARRNQAAASEKQLAAEKIIFDNPFVQTLMQDFGAKIVAGSIKPL